MTWFQWWTEFRGWALRHETGRPDEFVRHEDVPTLRSIYREQLRVLRGEEPSVVRRHKRQILRIWMLGSQVKARES